MDSLNRRILGVAFGCLLLPALIATAAFAQNPNCPSGSGEICSVPATQAFANTYVGKASGNKVLTIYNNVSATITIETIGFSCTTGSPTDWGIASGTVPFQMGIVQTLTHYSIFFQPHTAMSESCNFVVTMQDGFVLNVPLTGTGLSGGGVSSLDKTSLTFSNQGIGTISAAQTVTITNSGTSSMNLEAINISPPSFTINSVTLPAKLNAGASITLSVSYTPTAVGSETGVLDLDYDAVPDNGVTLSGTGKADTSLTISNSPTLPQATQGFAYQANLGASAGTAPFTWALASGSTLPSGLTLSSAGVISGTLASSVATGNYNFTVQVTDSASHTSSTTFTLGVFAYLGNGNGESCNNLSWNDPVLGTPMLALTDLGTGMYQGISAGEGGLYPNGSNSRPAGHDSDGVAFADAIQPLDANGNPSPTGKYVLMAIGESTAQNEFGRFLPIANADPAKNPSLVIVNGAQGGATPNQFTSTTSAYWTTVLQNYLPQNGVTAQQVVAIWMEDTDGIATGSFPSDISTLQSEYETMMRTMLTLFPNLKLVYFSSRVYAGYSNGVTTPPPPNPEPYAYEVGFAVKGAIGDQINGVGNLNYDSKKGAVVAPWMSWGTYYWSNGMLGRSDGLVWDCEDFSSDGTHPSTTFGQLKVATKLLQFLKTDDTTVPWYLTPNLTLMPTAGNNQTGNPGTTLPSVLTVEAENLNSGVPQSGVAVTFNDGGAGGTFGTPSGNTGSDGTISTTYTLPATGQTVSITASASKYASGIFTETAVAQLLAATGGNNQSGTVGSTLPVALTVTATSNGIATAGVSVTFSDGGAGGTFGTPTGITGSDGTASTTYTLPSTAKTITITASAAGYTSASFTETSTASSGKVLTATSGNNQTGTVGTKLTTPLTVTATNNGVPTKGLKVTFSDGGVGGVFSLPTGATNASGTISTTYTLPATAQTVTITATATAYTSATFTETATVAVVSSITLVSGGKQTGTVGSVLPQPIVVKAKNSSGQGLSGVSISFTDASAGGTFNPNPAITNSTGQASTSYTLPTKPKSISVTASSGSVNVKTTEQSVAGPPSILSIVSGNNQTGQRSKPLPKALVVSVTDQFSNGLAGVTVTFTDNGAGGTFSTTSPITTSNGQASVTYTAGSTARTVTITASTSSLTPVNFTETIH